ncbi:hypothetical protein Kpho01_30950 [Kitasatospora phosalacinea]|uniref:Uncharacterized protein n=1 Tax=Kitasatospora phosalacinea TaxID=2065 RepID=A0A9W6PHL1_9ACTN|nr:hypothetical protein Kpho01_30950 [Kitasatospora phosalacinea]
MEPDCVSPVIVRPWTAGIRWLPFCTRSRPIGGRCLPQPVQFLMFLNPPLPPGPVRVRAPLKANRGGAAAAGRAKAASPTGPPGFWVVVS